MMGQERGGGAHLHLYLTLAGKTPNLLLCIVIFTEEFVKTIKCVLINMGIEFYFSKPKKKNKKHINPMNYEFSNIMNKNLKY